jgi:hypothetical protein
MKKKIVIFRFGVGAPTQGDFLAIDRITGGERNACGMGTHFGIMSIVNTSMSPQEIRDLFAEIEKETDDALPVIVYDAASEGVSALFSEGFFPNFKEMDADFEQEYGTASPERVQCTLSLDELLDLVSKKGLPNLTEDELKRLKELSR